MMRLIRTPARTIETGNAAAPPTRITIGDLAVGRLREHKAYG